MGRPCPLYKAAYDGIDPGAAGTSGAYRELPSREEPAHIVARTWCFDRDSLRRPFPTYRPPPRALCAVIGAALETTGLRGVFLIGHRPKERPLPTREAHLRARQARGSRGWVISSVGWMDRHLLHLRREILQQKCTWLSQPWESQPSFDAVVAVSMGAATCAQRP